MRSLMATLARLAPLLFIVIVGVLLRLLAVHPSAAADGAHAVHGGARALLFVAIALWLAALFGWWHARSTRAVQAAAASRRPAGDAGALAKTLKAKVIGRDATCDELASQVRRRLAFQSRSRPVGVFVLAGPDGTGKTYLAQVLANVLGRPFVHLEMAEYARGGANTQLFGSTRGILDAYRYGTLTAVLRDTPDAVILLQDFEKAHAEVHANILAALVDGVVTEASDGKAKATTQAIFVMTTDVDIAATNDFAEQPASSPGGALSAATQALVDAGWTLEVLQRVDRVFVLRPLASADRERVEALGVDSSRAGASRFGSRFELPERAVAPERGWGAGAGLWSIAALVAALVTVTALVIGREPRVETTSGDVVAKAPGGQADAPSGASSSGAASAPTSGPASAATYDVDEQRALAVCHPRLARAPQVPRIDPGDMPTPELVRLKFRFWVNGSGAVVRDKLVGGALGTAAERDEAQRFLYQQTYNIPNIGDCHARREIELVGNFFLQHTRQGAWETLFAVHPLYSLDDDGLLQVSD